MPYLTLTLTENLKLQLSPGVVASYDIQPGNGVGLFWDKHTHVYLLTYLPRTHTGLLGNDMSEIVLIIFPRYSCLLTELQRYHLN